VVDIVKGDAGGRRQGGEAKVCRLRGWLEL